MRRKTANEKKREDSHAELTSDIQKKDRAISHGTREKCCVNFFVFLVCIFVLLCSGLLYFLSTRMGFGLPFLDLDSFNTANAILPPSALLRSYRGLCALGTGGRTTDYYRHWFHSLRFALLAPNKAD